MNVSQKRLRHAGTYHDFVPYLPLKGLHSMTTHFFIAQTPYRLLHASMSVKEHCAQAK